MLEARASVVG